MPRIKIKLLRDTCLPERTHRWDAGWDLKALKDTIIPAGKTQKVHTGVIMEIPPHYCGMIVPRSSLGTKYRVTLANDIGIIDSEYRGEIIVFLSNDSEVDYKINRDDRFAQLVIVAINNSELWVVDRLSETERGSGGFGSTTKYIDHDHEGETPVAVFTLKEDNNGDLQTEKVEILVPLKELKPGEYIKLKKSKELFNLYPEATGDMHTDLGL